MSRTNHKARRERRGLCKEYWKSRLHAGGETTGRATKVRTHRKERREGKSEAVLRAQGWEG